MFPTLTVTFPVASSGMLITISDLFPSSVKLALTTGVTLSRVTLIEIEVVFSPYLLSPLYLATISLTPPVKLDTVNLAVPLSTFSV